MLKHKPAITFSSKTPGKHCELAPSAFIVLSTTKSSDEGEAIKRDAEGKDDDEVPSMLVVSKVDELLVVCTLLF